jgi:hypothetical protein
MGYCVQNLAFEKVIHIHVYTLLLPEHLIIVYNNIDINNIVQYSPYIFPELSADC